jgi:hypothetical protein
MPVQKQPVLLSWPDPFEEGAQPVMCSPSRTKSSTAYLARRCRVLPRIGCALGATEVQSSQEESQSRLHVDKRGHPLVETLRPIRRRDKDDRAEAVPPLLGSVP